jgi:hypothetical protein
MPKPAMRLSGAHNPDLEEIQRENEALRREVAALKAQLATIHIGIKAVLDAVGLPSANSTLADTGGGSGAH